LARKIELHGKGIVFVESVYSIEGDILNRAVVDVAKSHDCIVILDESHSIGGTVTKSISLDQGYHLESDIITFSLSKALAGHGGAIAIQPRFTERYLYHRRIEAGRELTQQEIAHDKKTLGDRIRRAGPLVFTNSPSEIEFAGVLARERIIETEPYRSREVRQTSGYIIERLKKVGLQLHRNPQLYGLKSEPKIGPLATVIHFFSRKSSLGRCIFLLPRL